MQELGYCAQTEASAGGCFPRVNGHIPLVRIEALFEILCRAWLHSHPTNSVAQKRKWPRAWSLAHQVRASRIATQRVEEAVWNSSPRHSLALRQKIAIPSRLRFLQTGPPSEAPEKVAGFLVNGDVKCLFSPVLLIAGICGIAAISRDFRRWRSRLLCSPDCMAERAVRSEPVSARNPC